MEDQETKPQSLTQHALRWALITAVINIAITIVLYIIDYTVLVQLKLLIFTLAVYFGIIIYAGIDYRKNTGGFIAYGKALQHGFLILAISGLISTVFSIFFYTIIDPDLPQKLTDASIENTRAIMERFGTPEDSIDNALEGNRDKIEEGFSVSGLSLGYIRILIFSLLIALISALIVKKGEPATF
jgi:hypothetical protein